MAKGSGWGVEGESSRGRGGVPRNIPVTYSGGAKPPSKNGCPLTALMMLPLIPFAMGRLAYDTWKKRKP